MRINGWQRLGIVISVMWLVFSTWAYFYELRNYPSILAAYLPHAGYEWIQDIEATKKAHEDAQQHGNDFSNRFILLKPMFDTYGFLKFILSPLVICWFSVYLVLRTFLWVRRGFRE